MDSNQIIELMRLIGIRYSRLHLSIIVPDSVNEELVENEIVGLKDLGYHVMIHDSVFGKELVITDKRTCND